MIKAVAKCGGHCVNIGGQRGVIRGRDHTGTWSQELVGPTNDKAGGIDQRTHIDSIRESGIRLILHIVRGEIERQTFGRLPQQTTAVGLHIGSPVLTAVEGIFLNAFVLLVHRTKTTVQSVLNKRPRDVTFNLDQVVIAALDLDIRLKLI